jgi:hypothetical protein
VVVHVPIIHTHADMGALGKYSRRAFVARFGEQLWADKQRLVDRFWMMIEEAVEWLPFIWKATRVYQDGLPVCGHESEIVADLARAGSRNHRLLLRLREFGAIIMGTESAELLVEEYQLTFTEQPPAPPSARTGSAAENLSRDLLKRRDRYIAERIGETLVVGETGLVFLGLLHRLEGIVARDIKLINIFAIKNGHLS